MYVVCTYKKQKKKNQQTEPDITNHFYTVVRNILPNHEPDA